MNDEVLGGKVLSSVALAFLQVGVLVLASAFFLGLVEILPTAGVLIGFAVLFFTIGLSRFRYE